MEVSYLFGYAIWGIFIALSIKEIVTYLNGKSSESWRRHKAIVTDIRVDVKKVRDPDDDGFIGEEKHYAMPLVRYKYQYLGGEYLSKRVPLNDNWSDDYGDSTGAVVGINPGSEIIVYVNPRKPQQSVLTRGYKANNLTELAFVFIAVLITQLLSK